MINITLTQKDIENRIFTVNGVQVMLDSHLAEIYNIETKQLNKAVKRNIERFPEAFMFQLSQKEWETLRFQNDSSNNKIADDEDLRFHFGTSKEQGRGGRRYHPYVFTEQGVAMLSAILKSETAIKISVLIISAFVEMRKLLFAKNGLMQRMDRFELKIAEHEHKFEHLFKAMENKKTLPDKGIFFNGQVFDAYTFVVDLIKNAKSSLIVIDNYIDDTVLTMLSKRNMGVKATIYTKNINKQIQLDLEKHNSQYPEIKVVQVEGIHDRFLIIDNKQLYHIGASFKDLGKKWFAFSKMNDFIDEILAKLK